MSRPTVDELTYGLRLGLSAILESHPHMALFKKQLASGELERRWKVIGKDFDPQGRVDAAITIRNLLARLDEQEMDHHLRQQLDDMTEERDSLLSSCHTFEQQLDDMRKENDALDLDYSLLRDDYTQMEMQLTNLTQVALQQRQDKEQALYALGKEQDIVADLTKERDALKIESVRAYTLRAALDLVKRERDDAVDMREGSLMRIDGLRVDLADAQATILQLQSELVELKAKLADRQA